MTPPVSVDGQLPSNIKQSHSVPTKIQDEGLRVFNLGKDIDGEPIIAIIGSDTSEGLTYYIINKAWVHENGSPTDRPESDGKDVGKDTEVRITNPNTKDYIIAKFVPGKERS